MKVTEPNSLPNRMKLRSELMGILNNQNASYLQAAASSSSKAQKLNKLLNTRNEFEI